MLLDVIGSKKRLEILKLLSRGDKYVSQIMDLAKMDGKRAKLHLDKLEETGLITSYKRGRRRYYKLQQEIRMEIKPPPKGKFLLYKTNN